MAKFGPMVESCSTLPSLFVFFVFAKVQNWHIAVLLISPFYPNVVPARESHPGVALFMSSQSHIPFGRSFNFEDVLSLWPNLGKQKEPITQSIRNRRERGSRFKVMFYVIGSEDQSRVLLSTAPANRTKGVVEQFGTSGVPIPCRMNRLIMSQYGRTFIFSCYVVAYRCAIIIQIMRYAVKLAKPLIIFGTTENENQRFQKMSLYLLGRFQKKYQRTKNSVQPGQNFQN